MDIKTLVEYKHIFGDTEYSSLEDLLKDIDRNLLVRVAAYFLKGFYDDFDFFCTSGTFFSTPNSDFADKLLRELKSLNSIRPHIIFNNFSSLLFLEKILSMPNVANDNKDPQVEINVLKAYLIINQSLLVKERNLINNLKTLDKEEELVRILFYQSLAYSDLVNYNYRLELVAQTIKAIYFLKFCKKRLPEHLSKFCEKYNKENWEEYLKFFLGIIYTLLSNEENNIPILELEKGNKDFANQSLFLGKFCINDEDLSNDRDFTKIREFPLYKESETSYIVLFDLFLTERIYRSLYFDFKDINDEINKTKEKNKISNFRHFITDDFSEKSIFYDLLDKIFEGEDFVNHKGSDFLDADSKIQGEPDYYVRKDNDIFLFESKDNLMNAEIKSSYDYDEITKDLDKKLNQKKGLKQICNNIDKILKKEYSIDTNYNEKTINIYPILVLHERIYSNVGLNYILNKWFDNKIKPIKDFISNPERIKPLVIIDIDTFILLQNVDEKYIFDFKKLLDDYYNKTEHIIIGEEELKDKQKFREASVSKYKSFKNFIEPIITENTSEMKLFKEKLTELIGLNNFIL